MLLTMRKRWTRWSVLGQEVIDGAGVPSAQVVDTYPFDGGEVELVVVRLNGAFGGKRMLAVEDLWFDGFGLRTPFAALAGRGLAGAERRPPRGRGSRTARAATGASRSPPTVSQPRKLRRAMAPQLWMLRHGEAVPHDSKPDDERELTPRGRRQSEAAGAALAALNEEFAACYTSPKVRALRDRRARLRSASTSSRSLESSLADGFSRVDALALLDAHDADAKILVVGHEPSFSQVVYDFTGGRVDFKKGGVAALQRAPRRRRAARARCARRSSRRWRAQGR